MMRFASRDLVLCYMCGAAQQRMSVDASTLYLIVLSARDCPFLPLNISMGNCRTCRVHPQKVNEFRWKRPCLVFWHPLGGVCRGGMRAWRSVLMLEQRPGRRVAVCSSCRRVVLLAACVVLLACFGGLTLLTCACAFGGFLL